MSDPTPTRRTVLKTTAGFTVAATGLAAASGSAAAHFPPELAVDVKPRSGENTVNPRSDGVTRVAVRRTDEFDPAAEDVRYRFGAPDEVADGGGAKQVRHRVEDVEGDGRDDVVLQFRTSETGIEHGDDEAELRWDRDEDRAHGLSGRDEIRTVGDGRGR